MWVSLSTAGHPWAILQEDDSDSLPYIGFTERAVVTIAASALAAMAGSTLYCY